MRLTKVQVKKLRLYQEYVRTEPTLGRCLWNIKWSLVSLVGLGFIGYVIAPSDIFRWLIVGFAAGLLWAAFATTRNTSVSWPLLREIVDWQKADKLLKDNEKDSG
jgi:hypothetical protein